MRNRLLRIQDIFQDSNTAVDVVLGDIEGRQETQQSFGGEDEKAVFDALGGDFGGFGGLEDRAAHQAFAAHFCDFRDLAELVGEVVAFLLHVL